MTPDQLRFVRHPRGTTMTTTAQLQIRAAADQFERIIDAFDAREQQARGNTSHVPIATDAELRRIAAIGLAHLGECR